MWRSCLKIELVTGILSENAQMVISRCAFGVGHIGHFIYAVAGLNSSFKFEQSYERYDVLANKWALMPASSEFDNFGAGVSLVVSSKRYLTMFSRMSDDDDDKEMISLLDHFRPQSGWSRLSLKRPLQTPCGQYYGLMNVSKRDDCDEKSSIIVSGGRDNDYN